MNLRNAKKLIHKIEALVQTLDSAENISRLERDLLRSYVIDLYESLFDIEIPGEDSQSFLAEKQEAYTNPVQEVRKNTMPFTKTPVEENPVSASPPKEHEKREITHQSAMESTPDIKDEEAKPASTTSSEDQTKEENENTNGHHKRVDINKMEALFEAPEARELSDQLSAQPLQKVESGMGINERILTINELFGGDIKRFENTLADLNAMNSFDEAKSYLKTNIAGTYGWDTDEKFKKASHFIRIVRRKYAQGDH